MRWRVRTLITEGTPSPSNVCHASYRTPTAALKCSIEINIIMLFLLLEMQSTRQQKKYFSSVSPQRKILMGHKFSRVSDEGFIYVDKTPFIKRLVEVTSPGSGVFVNRPRRFGKSLLVSTLEEYFKGNKEAFKGTAIYNDPEVKWEKWPVIKLDMSEVGGSTFEKFELSLVELVRIL